jgi:hypothetical protein
METEWIIQRQKEEFFISQRALHFIGYCNSNIKEFFIGARFTFKGFWI